MDLASGRNDPAAEIATPAPSAAAPLEVTVPPTVIAPTVTLHPAEIARRSVTVLSAILHLVETVPLLGIAHSVILLLVGIALLTGTAMAAPLAGNVPLLGIVHSAFLYLAGNVPLLGIVHSGIPPPVGIVPPTVIVQRVPPTVIVQRVPPTVTPVPAAIVLPTEIVPTGTPHPGGIVRVMEIVMEVLLGVTVPPTAIGRSAIPPLAVAVPLMVTAPRVPLTANLPPGVTGPPMETANVRHALLTVIDLSVILLLGVTVLRMATVTPGQLVESVHPMGIDLSDQELPKIHVSVHEGSVPSAFAEVLSKRR